MSYCRWSSDNFYCDLYCYESDQGYETHVAGRRRFGPLAEFPPFDLESQTFQERYVRYQEALDSSVLVPIDLPHAGESFTDHTLDEFEERLRYLRGVGYVFPDEVFGEIAEERALPPYQYEGVVA